MIHTLLSRHLESSGIITTTAASLLHRSVHPQGHRQGRLIRVYPSLRSSDIIHSFSPAPTLLLKHLIAPASNPGSSCLGNHQQAHIQPNSPLRAALGRHRLTLLYIEAFSGISSIFHQYIISLITVTNNNITIRDGVRRDIRAGSAYSERLYD